MASSKGEDDKLDTETVVLSIYILHLNVYNMTKYVHPFHA